jgi:hypothetical protein
MKTIEIPKIPKKNIEIGCGSELTVTSSDMLTICNNIIFGLNYKIISNTDTPTRDSEQSLSKRQL